MGPAPQPFLVPEFSYCSTTIHYNIRIPVPYAWVEDIYPRSDDPEWEDKIDERLLWRGANTGIYHSKTSRWKQSHRNFLVEFANDFGGVLDIIPPDRTRSEKLMDLKELKKAMINPAVLDIAFGGQPISCAPDVCDVVKARYPWRERQSIAEAGKHKYVIDVSHLFSFSHHLLMMLSKVDGNGWSGRFKRLITSNSLVFKSTLYPEWSASFYYYYYIDTQIQHQVFWSYCPLGTLRPHPTRSFRPSRRTILFSRGCTWDRFTRIFGT